jgi:hypothetical protein
MDKARARLLDVDWFALDLDEYAAEAPLRVLSVHPQAINLQVDGWPHLLLLAGPRLERGPAAVGLDESGFEMLRFSLRPGTAGFFEPGLIRLTGAGQEMCITWRERPAVSFAPPCLPAVEEPERLRATLERYRQWLPRTGVDSSSSVLFNLPGGEEYFRNAIRDTFPPVIFALLKQNKQDFECSCRKLIGMGRGATPAGDDLIYGASVAHRWYGAARREEREIPRLNESCLNQTSLLGRHMLEMGRRGLAADPVKDFMVTLLQGKPSPAALRRICGIGASTGYDSASAIIYFLQQAVSAR